MAYTLQLRRGSSNLLNQSFSTVAIAVEAAVNIKAAATDAERKDLVMSVSDADGNLIVKDAEIDRVYREFLE